jgi:TonB-linked SusC/RagA family outer membrane protein
MRKTSQLLAGLLLCLPLLLHAQTASYEIKGRVLHAINGKPLTGATVHIQNGGETGSTDAEGYFNLKHDKVSAQVTVSYVGFRSRQLIIKAGEPVSISLMDIEKDLDEVVVRTGYQQLPKERSNGSFEVIDSNLLSRVPAFDVLSRLDGQAGSIYFNKAGGAGNITIRGISSLTAALQQPLIILDNFPYEGDINQINPNDIEQVTVLKDAAAASIWGSRAGNGVIVITTKKGRRNAAPSWKFNYNVGLTEKPDLYSMSRMTSSDFIDVEKFLFGKGFYNSAINNTSSRPVLSPVVEWLQQQKTGQITEMELAARIEQVKGNDVRDEFLKYLYQPALLQQFHLQLSGGGQQIQYALSAGYDRNRETTIGDRFQRFTLRSDNSYQPWKNVEINAGVIVTRTVSEQNSPGDYFTMVPGGGKSVLYPYAKLANEDGSPAVVLKDYRAAYTDTAGGGLLLDWKYRPLQEMQLLDNRSQTDHVLGKLGVKIRLIKGLDAEVRYQLESGLNETDANRVPDTYMARNLVNRYTQISGGTIKNIIPYGGILDASSERQMSQQGRAMLNYQLNQTDHQVAALAGAEIRQSNFESNSNRLYGYREDPLIFSNIDFVNSYPIYGNLSGPTTIYNGASVSNTLQRFVSFFANAGYTYRNRYSVSGSIRKDGSNLFGVNSNQRTVPLWSAGGGWTVSKEGFYKLNWLPFLKLRATYGVSGNTNTNVTAYSVIRYYPAAGNVVNLPYAAIQTPANPDLQWETVAMFNVAVDFSTKGKRLSGSIEYYRKKATNLLTDAPLDPTSGFTTGTFNSGEMKGTGVECNLHLEWFQRKFQWSTDLLLNYSTNKITKYDLAVASGGSYVGKETTINALEGYSAFGVFAYRWGGLTSTTGDPIGLIDGKETTNYTDLVSKTPVNQLDYYGSSRPPHFGVVRNTLSYGPWRLSANIGYQLGHYFRLQSIQYNILYSSWATHGDYTKRWQTPGDELKTHVPSMPYPSSSNRDDFYNYSSVLIEKADHIRLQDIRLDYQFSLKLKQPFRVQVFLYANNLGLIWAANDAGKDPAYGTGLAAPKSISGGLQLNF